MTEKIEKIDVEQLTKKLRVDNAEAFNTYLKDVFTDLYSRIAENKNDSKEKQNKINGITKTVFDKYYELPGIIGDRLFRVFNKKNREYISLSDFTSGMINLFCEDFDKTSKFIFDFYDYDNDGKITKEDIKTILSYITLGESPNSKSPMKDITYKNRVTSQEDLNKILKKCYNNIKGEYMTYDDFKKVVEEVNSDIYLMIYLFLLENKPFKRENIISYMKPEERKNTTTLSPSPKKMIASPSKNTQFSPYRKFTKRKSVYLETQNDKIHQMISNSPNNIDSPTQKRQSRRRRTMERKDPIILLQNMELNKDVENKKNKEINNKRVKEITKSQKVRKDYPEKDVPIEPAYKQSMKKRNLNNNPLSKEKLKDDDEEEKMMNEDYENDSDSDNDENYEYEDDEEVIKYEGYLYKLIDNKMRKLWFKLVHRDLYFFKDKKEDSHRGMHNLSGLFIQVEEAKVFEGKKYYCFSVVYPAKTRIYYCTDEKEYKGWIENLKKATGFTNLLDIYDVKQKLGNGKFGLVKLGVNKQTKEKVAIKIMNKNKMDSSDVELMRTEIEILKICQHPNIIRLYDIFENIDYIYIIMEYCPGGDLFSYLENRNFKVSEERAAILMKKMCDAVFYFQSFFGVIHRDLKPENVLMTSDKDDGDIRILDFGLSKISIPNEKCTEPYGTLTYCAPEIILDEPYNKEVDMWSLGIMTYLMVSGRLPFNSEDENKIARKIAFDEPDYEKNSCWKTLSCECIDFIKKLLNKDPKKRMIIEDAIKHPWFKKFVKENK
jgi:Ca2+-binding EF-hand superfamily protein